jgi:hypothetical protein
MKKVFYVIAIIFITFSCSKSSDNTDSKSSVSDCDKFVGKYDGCDFLDISKINNSQIMLSFYVDKRGFVA